MISIVWVVFVLLDDASDYNNIQGYLQHISLSEVLIYIIPPAFIFVIGLVLLWVLRGFRDKTKKHPSETLETSDTPGELTRSERIKRAWRIFLAAPVQPMNRTNFNKSLAKLYFSDSRTRNMLDNLGIARDQLNNPSFDLREFLWNKNRNIALIKALESEEGLELLNKSGSLDSDREPDRTNLASINAEILQKFGSPDIEAFLRSLPY
jgi:hypothetical protein